MYASFQRNLEVIYNDSISVINIKTSQIKSVIRTRSGCSVRDYIRRFNLKEESYLKWVQNSSVDRCQEDQKENLWVTHTCLLKGSISLPWIKQNFASILNRERRYCGTYVPRPQAHAWSWGGCEPMYTVSFFPVHT